MTGIWSDPEFSGAPQGKVFVLGIGATEVGTRLFEDAMAEQLAKHKMQVVKGSQVFPVNSAIDTTALREYVTQNGINLLSVTRLVDISSETQYVPGTTAYIPVAGYRTWGGYYTASYAVVHEPGYLRTSKTAIIETNVYSTSANNLVWSGRSKTVDPSSIEDAVWDIASGLVGSMADRGVFGSKAKK
jgi:stage V sporulation protein SpoVS